MDAPLISVRFRRDVPPYAAGELAGFPQAKAADFVEKKGWADYVVPEAGETGGPSTGEATNAGQPPEIPENWPDLSWAELRKLAVAVSPPEAKVTSKDDATKAIEAELARRAETAKA